jgi:hypothetical protein
MDEEEERELTTAIQALLGLISKPGKTVRESLQDGIHLLDNLSKGMLDSYLDMKTEIMLRKYRIPFGVIGNSSTEERFPLELVLTSKQIQKLKESSKAIKEIGQILNSESSFDCGRLEFNEKTRLNYNHPSKTDQNLKNSDKHHKDLISLKVGNNYLILRATMILKERMKGILRLCSLSVTL